MTVEFLVETTIDLPPDFAGADLAALRAAENDRAAKLSLDGTLVRLWRPADREDALKNIGVWSGRTERELRDALDSLPMRPWMTFHIRALEPHPNDPDGGSR